MSALFNFISIYNVKAKCADPLHVGLGGGTADILAKNSTGEPFIQGTSLAGAFLSYTAAVMGEEEKGFFGRSASTANGLDGKSKIVFTEGSFSPKSLKLEMRTRVSIDGITGSVKSTKGKGDSRSSGQLMDVEYIAKGSELLFSIFAFSKNADEKEKTNAVIKKCLAAMHEGILTIGGMSTIGCGKLELINVQAKSFDMTKKDMREQWAELNVGECSTVGDSILDEIKKLRVQNPYYEVAVSMELRTPFSIKANTVNEDFARELLHPKDSDKLPDSMPIVNGQKEFIIPGSSIKGIFRSRMELIADYLGIAVSLLDASFESKSDCMFEDAVITGTKEDGRVISQPRIHINKISGGVMYKAFFNDMTIGGAVSLRILIHRNSAKADAIPPEALLGLVLYVIRDIDAGAVTFGNGAGIGRGYMSVDNITINSDETDGDGVSFTLDKAANYEVVKNSLSKLMEFSKKEMHV